MPRRMRPARSNSKQRGGETEMAKVSEIIRANPPTVRRETPIEEVAETVLR